MLFVSRLIGATNYGVVDTDDGVEEIITDVDLIRITKLGLEIKGIDADGFARCYQDPLTMSLLQIKTNAIDGVSVFVYKDYITSIRRSAPSLRPGTRIRLSQFGKRFSDYVLEQVMDWNKIDLVLVVDDQFELTYPSTNIAPMFGVAFDITEVTNEEAAQAIYSSYRRYSSSLKLSEFCIDRPDRMNYQQALLALSTGEHDKGVTFTLETWARIREEFTPKFQSIDLGELHFNSTTRDGKAYMKDIRSAAEFWRSRCQDCFEVLAHDCETFDAIGRLANAGGRPLRWFHNYLMFFPLTDELKRVYVDLCNTFNNWFLDYAEEAGW